MDNANGGAPTGTDITGGAMPSGGVSVSCVAIETGNDNHLLATYTNFGLNSVWELPMEEQHGLQSKENLPDMPIRWALFSPLNNTQAMLATDLGVWSTDLLNGWRN